MADEKLRSEKGLVKEFYDSFGWRKNAAGIYNDTALFADLAPVLRTYYERTNQRVQRHLRPRGQYFLDAGSGPVPHDNYVVLSAGYRFRVCADLSELALREARSRLGEKGRYVCADMTRLPFKDDVFDAVFSAHAIYHIPADEQERAISELQRVLNPGARGVIIYAQPGARFTTAVEGFVTAAAEGYVGAKRRLEWIPGLVPLWRALKRRRVRSIATRGLYAQAPPRGNVPRLYFHAHPYSWLCRRAQADCDTDVCCFTAVDPKFTRTLIPHNALGRGLMSVISSLEDFFPHVMARIGCYPMLVMTKRSSTDRGSGSRG